MTKVEFDHMLENTVATALGLDKPHSTATKRRKPHRGAVGGRKRLR